MIDNLEHISFIEGLLFYIALRLGDKDTLMKFLRAWGDEYEKSIAKDGIPANASGQNGGR